MQSPPNKRLTQIKQLLKDNSAIIRLSSVMTTIMKLGDIIQIEFKFCSHTDSITENSSSLLNPMKTTKMSSKYGYDGVYTVKTPCHLITSQFG